MVSNETILLQVGRDLIQFLLHFLHILLPTTKNGLRPKPQLIVLNVLIFEGIYWYKKTSSFVEVYYDDLRVNNPIVLGVILLYLLLSDLKENKKENAHLK